MRNIIFALVFSIFLTSCHLIESDPPHIEEAFRISGTFLATMRTKYPHYKPYGSGGAWFERVNGFLFKFATWEDISEEQAQKDIMDIYQILMDRVNNDVRIRPHLSEWPFEDREGSVGIIFFDSDNEFRSAPKIAKIGISAGKMYKDYYDPENKRLMSEKKYELWKVQKAQSQN